MCLCSCHLLENSSPQEEQVVARSCSLVPTITTPPLLTSLFLASTWRRLAAWLVQPAGVKREEVEEQTRQQWRAGLLHFSPSPFLSFSSRDQNRSSFSALSLICLIFSSSSPPSPLFHLSSIFFNPSTTFILFSLISFSLSFDLRGPLSSGPSPILQWSSHPLCPGENMSSLWP